MGKKKKNKNKSFYKKYLKGLLKGNRSVIVAALTGTATGIALAGILGTEKAKQLVQTVEDGIKDFGTKISRDVRSGNSYKGADDGPVKKPAAMG
jgi:hypothetical protein